MSIADLAVRVSADVDNFTKSISNVDTQLGSWGKKMQTLGGQMSKFGKSMTKYITAPVAGVTAAVVGMVAAFGWKRLVAIDEARAKLQGLGYDVADVERISKQVNAAVMGTTMTMAEGTSVAAGALAAGVKEGAELEKYIRRVGNAAVGANRDVGDMAMIFNRVQGMGRLMTQELNMIEDGMPGFSLAMAKHMGVSLAEFRKMVTGGKVSSEEFMTVMDNFAGGMAEAYAGTWSGMVANTKANIGRIGESLLGGVFEQSKDSITEFLELLRSDEAQTWARETGAKIGEAFGQIVEGVKSVIAWWTNLDDDTKKLITTIAGIIVVAGPILLIIGKIITVVGSVSVAIGKVIGVVKGLITVAKAVGLVIAGISAPVAIAIAAVAAIIAIGVLLWKNWDTVKAKAIEIWGAIKNFFSGLWESIKTIFGNAWDSIKKIFSAENARNVFNSVITAIKNVFSAIPNWFREKFSNAWENVKKVFSSGGSIFTGIKEGIASTFKTIVNGLINGINLIIRTPFNAINRMLNTIRNISVMGVSPFRNLWGYNPLPVPQIPKLEAGTNYVPKDTFAYLHKGEAVVPKKYNPDGGTRNINLTIDIKNVPAHIDQATLTAALRETIRSGGVDRDLDEAGYRSTVTRLRPAGGYV